jgi:hypothetical protein
MRIASNRHEKSLTPGPSLGDNVTAFFQLVSIDNTNLQQSSAAFMKRYL